MPPPKSSKRLLRRNPRNPVCCKKENWDSSLNHDLSTAYLECHMGSTLAVSVRRSRLRALMEIQFSVPIGATTLELGSASNEYKQDLGSSSVAMAQSQSVGSGGLSPSAIDTSAMVVMGRPRMARASLRNVERKLRSSCCSVFHFCSLAASSLAAAAACCFSSASSSSSSSSSDSSKYLSGGAAAAAAVDPPRGMLCKSDDDIGRILCEADVAEGTCRRGGMKGFARKVPPGAEVDVAVTAAEVAIIVNTNHVDADTALWTDEEQGL
mmetsp:Transcript_23463/g.67611  ORF Transcript_23463/g.67611 Transcript_23463/m.67611 type:complete len:267 (+) Transcript_23463:430-1230(+)